MFRVTHDGIRSRMLAGMSVGFGSRCRPELDVSPLELQHSRAPIESFWTNTDSCGGRQNGSGL
jgi:hypothetical protein